MLSFRASLALFLTAAIAASPAFATPTQKKSTTPHAHSARSAAHKSKRTSKSRKSSRKSRHAKLHGQQAIDAARATEIQQALIREHYLTGQPTGDWDSATVSAMQKFQADQGWQTKLTPDSRALKKLGLGPDYSNAINAQGSSFADPKPSSEIPTGQATGFAAASGVNR
ncbi:MAG TPA: peptidoglycan-binding domain-containing protein [Terracidiphilus sp.]|nr:peptidoglycan-binding domain-containing protein [Terracidiphilus sp.]